MFNSKIYTFLFLIPISTTFGSNNSPRVLWNATTARKAWPPRAASWHEIENKDAVGAILGGWVSPPHTSHWGPWWLSGGISPHRSVITPPLEWLSSTPGSARGTNMAYAITRLRFTLHIYCICICNGWVHRRSVSAIQLVHCSVANQAHTGHASQITGKNSIKQHSLSWKRQSCIHD